MSRLFLCALWLAPLIASCKTTTPACQADLDACMARCQRSGAEENPPQTRGVPPEVTLTYCQDQCDECRAPTAPAKPSAPPTYTGTAK